MKTWMKWTLAVALVALLAASAWRALNQRQVQREALERQQQSQRTQASVTLQPSEQWLAKTVELPRSLAISGTVKARNVAWVKARVAGELQQLDLREGERVQAGQVVARVDATESRARLDQALQQAEAARAQVAIAQRSLDNNASLVQRGFISKTALEGSASTLAAAQATHRAAEAAAELARKTLTDTELRAPLTGLVSQRLAQAGERVAVEARLLEIVDLSQLELEAQVAAVDATDVQTGQHALLQVEGVAAPVHATVVRINPSASAANRAVPVYLRVEPGPGLRHGAFARAALMTGTVRSVAVPVSAVRTDKPAPYVQVVANQQVAHVPVTPGARGDLQNQTLVALSGLPENSLVLLGSVGSLRAGTPVRQPTTP